MNLFKRFYLSLFLSRRFYRLLGCIIFLFVVSYGLPFLFDVSQYLLLLFCLLCVLDWMVLFLYAKTISVQRMAPDRLSNGDDNHIQLAVKNDYPFRISLQLIDELPEQLQIRDFLISTLLQPGEKKSLPYSIRPKQRGEYAFGDIQAYVTGPLRLIIRRKTLSAKQTLKVFPSFLHLRQFEFQAHITDPGNIGFKQVRKTGHSLEFEQIREYVPGDDIRSINWKATGRTGGQLMINNYTDEKSQQVYCILDKGRVMKMPFEGMTLLDYAVHATLVMSGVALSRQDKSGLITFGEKGGDFIPANHRATQMNNILNALYKLETRFLESDYAFLHTLVKTRISQRSLLILFTNFESLNSLSRQLPYMRNISKKHLLLVVFFENTSLETLASGTAPNIERLYEKVIAEKFILEKKLIVKELQRYGIHALLTAPGKLTVDVVNKYLQIKARREI
ncbi:MAG: DUF58 domain-containing protein [Bacteroidota bacterium]|nr:DUF58 domain-containing protein [Bacteroidota bacterium]